MEYIKYYAIKGLYECEIQEIIQNIPEILELGDFGCYLTANGRLKEINKNLERMC